MGEGKEFDTKAAVIARQLELPQDQREEITALNVESELLRRRDIHPAAIRAALVSVEGVTDDDGQPVDTAEKLLGQATPELDGLLAEIYQACESASGLDAEETKNLPSPTTTDEQATGDKPTA